MARSSALQLGHRLLSSALQQCRLAPALVDGVQARLKASEVAPALDEDTSPINSIDGKVWP